MECESANYLALSWESEVFFGDWAFKGWSISPLKLRAGTPYFSATELPRPLARLHADFMVGPSIDLEKLQERLFTINDRVGAAVQLAMEEAEHCWKGGHVWVSRIDEALVADDDMAEIAIQSFDIGVEEVDAEPLLAALGLWLIGEWRSTSDSDASARSWAIDNLLIVSAVVGWYRGAAVQRQLNACNNSILAKRASDARHAENRRRKEEARAFWASRSWPSKAEAARAVTYHFDVVEQVALRWVREFSGPNPYCAP